MKPEKAREDMESHGCQGKPGTPGKVREGQGRPGRPGKAREAREGQGRPGVDREAKGGDLIRYLGASIRPLGAL